MHTYIQYITLHYMTLHDITLHDITLHTHTYTYTYTYTIPIHAYPSSQSRSLFAPMAPPSASSGWTTSAPSVGSRRVSLGVRGAELATGTS